MNQIHFNAWFTFSLKQYETRQEREYEEYIRLICHVLDLFLSRLEALGIMSVHQSQVKGNDYSRMSRLIIEGTVITFSFCS